MSGVSILGPPRSGRTVRSVDEVLAECERNQEEKNGFRGDVASGPGYTPTVEGIPAAGNQDIFSFEDLRIGSGGNITLYGLEIPAGRWDQISLELDHYGGGQRAGIYAWTMVSLGQGVLINNEYSRYPTPVTKTSRMITSKARYWFMRAAYETLPKDPHNQVANLIKTICAQDLRDGGFYHADMFLIDEDNAQLATYITMGWPQEHPLMVKRDIHWPPEKVYPFRTGIGIDGILSELFGDPDPERIERVLKWVVPSDNRSRIMVCSPPPQAMTTGYALDDTIIRISSDGNLMNLTRGLIADPAHFHARVRP